MKCNNEDEQVMSNDKGWVGYFIWTQKCKRHHPPTLTWFLFSQKTKCRFKGGILSINPKAKNTFFFLFQWEVEFWDNREQNLALYPLFPSFLYFFLGEFHQLLSGHDKDRGPLEFSFYTRTLVVNHARGVAVKVHWPLETKGFKS